MKAKSLWTLLCVLILACGLLAGSALAEEEGAPTTAPPEEIVTEEPTEAPRTPSPTEPPPWNTEAPTEEPTETPDSSEVFESGNLEVGPIQVPKVKVGKEHTFSFPLTYVAGMRRITTEQERNGVYTILGYLNFLEVTPVISDASSFPFQIERTDYSQLVIYPEGNGVIVNNERYEDTMRLRDDLTNDTYPIYFKVRYREVGSKIIEETEIRLFMEVTGAPTVSDDSGGGGGGGGGSDIDPSMPRLIIAGSSTNPETAMAGESFVLTLHLHNTSEEKAIKNIKVSFVNSEDEDYILPESGSSSFYLSSIGANEEIEQKITMMVRADAPEKVHSLGIMMEYEDSNATAITNEENVNVPVKQAVRLEIMNVNVDQDMELGYSGAITMEVNNLGKATLYNVLVTFEGDGFSATQQFLGNVESGQGTSVELEVNPDMDGYLSGLVTATSEDINGTQNIPQTSMAEFYVSAGDYYGGDDGWGDGSGLLPGLTDDGGGGWGDGEEIEIVEDETVPWYQRPALWVIVGGALLVIIIIIVIISRRKKRKALEEEYDLD